MPAFGQTFIDQCLAERAPVSFDEAQFASVDVFVAIACRRDVEWTGIQQ
jgi:hypothetical protein